MTLRPTSHCACGQRGHVRKTRGKNVHFPAATVHVREVQLFCPLCRRVWGCPEYEALAPSKANISWALVAWIGQRRFHQHRQIQEIQEELRQRVASVVEAVFHSSGGLAFPFRLPALERLERLEQAYDWTCQALRGAAAENRHLPEVVALKEILERYRWDAQKPREVARLVRRHGHTLRVVGAWFKAVREALDAFRDGLQDKDAGLRVDHHVVQEVEAKARATKGLEGQLGLALVAAVQKRREELLAPVVVDRKVVRVERTIVETEQSHRQWKRGVRRRTGRPRVKQELRHHGVALAFVANWDRPRFREVLGEFAGLVGKIRDVDDVRLGKARTAMRGLRPAVGSRSAGRRLEAGRTTSPPGRASALLQEANRSWFQ